VIVLQSNSNSLSFKLVVSVADEDDDDDSVDNDEFKIVCVRVVGMVLLLGKEERAELGVRVMPEEVFGG